MIEGSIRGRELETEEVFEPCIHCYSGWIVDQEEISFGEYELVEYPCFMCVGTGRRMDRDEREALRASRKGKTS